MKLSFFKIQDKKAKQWIIFYAISAMVMLTLHYVLDLKFFEEWKNYIPFLKRLTLSLFLISLILLARKLIEQFIITAAQTKGDEHNLLRVTRLVSALLILIVAVAFIFQKLYVLR